MQYIYAKDKSVMHIGKQYEKNHVCVVFPDMTGSNKVLLYKRSKDDHPYAVATTSTSKGVEWLVSDTDTAYSGDGKAQLSYYINNEIVKTVLYTTVIDESLADAPQTIPTAAQSWVAYVEDLTEENQLDYQEVKDDITDEATTRAAADTLLQTNKQDKLTAGSKINITNNIISADSQVFVATYGSTPLGYILTAISNGYTVYAKKTESGTTYTLQLQYYNNSQARFSGFTQSDNEVCWTVTGSTWMTSTVPYQGKLTAGENITIDDNNVISSTGGGTSYSAGDGINITDNTISAKTDGVTITTNQSGQLVASGQSYTAGQGLALTDHEFSVDTDTISTKTYAQDLVSDEATLRQAADYGLQTSKQDKLTAGSNIAINNNTISATDTVYSAGDNISIGSNNSISANLNVFIATRGTTTYNEVLTAYNSGKTIVCKTTGVTEYTMSLSSYYNDVFVFTTGKYYNSQYNFIYTTLSSTGWGAINSKFNVVSNGLTGANNKPIYINADGLADQCAYELNKTVPSNAVFTDTTYSNGSGLNLTGTTFSVDTTAIQPKLTAGSNVSISNNTISATDTVYTAGSNISISAQNVISATDTTYNDATIFAHGLMSANDKTKLEAIAPGAQVNVQPDWNQTTTTADDYIKNKPTIPAAANDGVLTITKNGTSVGTFSANQSSNTTIALTDTTYTAGNNITISGSTISATDTTYTAGSGISITNGVISLNVETITSETTY